MIKSVGIPIETKNNERRVGMTPAGVAALKSKFPDINVFVATGAGDGAGFSDDEYTSAGARVCADKNDVYKRSQLIVKVKEPQPAEIPLIRSNHVLFCYLHLAASKTLTQQLLDSGCTAFAYETVVVDGKTPLLAPMSDVAGRVAVQRGATFLPKLLSGVVGVPPANVMVIGAGVVGRAAAETARGMGAHVIVVDTSLAACANASATGFHTLFASEITGEMLENYDVDMLVGAVHSPGKKATRVVTCEAMKCMKKGSVACDVSIDQGGCFEMSRPTSHDEPTYEVAGITYYCVPNLPAVVPHTSTRALCNATLPYVIELVDMLQKFVELPVTIGFYGGINIKRGNIINQAVRDAM